MFTALVTTMDTYEGDVVLAGGLIDATKRQGTLKEFQRVVAIGSSVRTIKVGDLVAINPRNYAVRKHQPGSLKDGVISDNPVVDYKWNVLELNGVKHLLLQEQDIDFIITDYEEVPDQPQSNLLIPDTKIIV